MALNPNDANLDKIDPELKDFIVNEQIKSQIQAQIRKLNIVCFDKCIEKPGSSEEDPTFHLIRLPRDMIDRASQSGQSKVGTVFLYENSDIEIQDDKSKKIYSLIRNTPKNDIATMSSSSQRKKEHIVASEESDLLKISLQKGEAVHLGKIKLSTLLAVPKGDEIDV